MITFFTLELADATTLQYAVALPDDFDPQREYPVLLALPPGPQTREMVQLGLDIKTLPVAMFVGEQDSSWVKPMQATERTLSDLGGRVSLEIVPDEGHLIRSLAGGERLFDLLESFRQTG